MTEIRIIRIINRADEGNHELHTLGPMGRLRNNVEQALGPMGRLRNNVEQEFHEKKEMSGEKGIC